MCSADIPMHSRPISRLIKMKFRNCCITACSHLFQKLFHQSSVFRFLKIKDQAVLKPILKRLMYTAALLLVLPVALSDYCLAKTIQDSGGRTIHIHKPFKRIISLYTAHTENLFHLGLNDEIVGVSMNASHPAKALEKRKFSYHDDPEKILSVMPDLVLIRPMIDNGYPLFVKQLEKFNITVVSLQPGSVQEMYAYWMNLGYLTGKQTQAQKLVNDFKSRVQFIRSKTQGIKDKKRVYFEAIHSRMKTFTPGSMPIFALETAGGVNLADDANASRNTNIAVYGKERILSKAGQIDVFLAQKGVMNSVNIEMITKEPGFNIIKAVKNDRVYLIDECIVARPVPRLYQGILTIGRLLYPDLFSQIVKSEEHL